jgi:hypothetical protein
MLFRVCNWNLPKQLKHKVFNFVTWLYILKLFAFTSCLCT